MKGIKVGRIDGREGRRERGLELSRKGGNGRKEGMEGRKKGRSGR